MSENGIDKMKNTIYSPSESVQKAYLKESVDESDIRLFKNEMAVLLDEINEYESEEHNKNLVVKFLSKTLYNRNVYMVNTYQKTDLAIYKSNKPLVVFEFKGPGRPDMVTQDCLNKKSLYELVLYYLREEVGNKNNGITHLVITDCVHYFVFEKKLFYNLFARNKKFAQKVLDADNNKANGTDYIYNEIIKPVVEQIEHKFEYTYFDLSDFKSGLRKDDILRTRKFIAVYKFLSPAHLLRLPFNSDHNTLNHGFYRELLYIMGVEEVTKDNVRKITRIAKNAQKYSLVEQAWSRLEDYPLLNDDKRFDVALGLTLIWINRILFLKLLESQLVVFNKSRSVQFLDTVHIPGYDELHDLFIDVLGKPEAKRSEEMKAQFPMVPYLNSSLFELTDLEREYFPIGQLRLGSIDVFPATVVKDGAGKKIKGELPLLEYLFRFLSSYDFGAEQNDDILRHQSKTIINASVLGLIFEKINGYKDGSFFTPGYITQYICSQTLHRAVVDKFNAVKGWNCADFDELKDKIDYAHREDRTEANAIVNSLRICDPAAGSGHFLVSALNELIAIKSELRILQDHGDKPHRIQDWNIRVEDDELMIFNEDGDTFTYNANSPESQRMQETLFEEKRAIIENCLFGVDLNPKSVEICRLRLWIELLKNAYYHRQENGERVLQTLPNIDINIKVGDSLLSAIPVTINKSLGKGDSVRQRIATYKNNVREYKNTKDKAMRHIILQNIKGLKKLFFTKNELNLFEDNNQEIEERQEADKLQNHLEWMIEFPEVIDDNAVFLGFDVVIGNPPYISLEKLRESTKLYAKMPRNTKGVTRRCNYTTLTPRGDIYALFVERGLQLLRKGGLLSYILPNKWTKTAYGQPLRKLFLDRNLTDIVDFGDNQIFSDATTYTCIISMSNDTTAGNINITQINEVRPKALFDDVNEQLDTFHTKGMNDGLWVISSLENFHRVKKAQAAMTTLGHYVGDESYRGILTGLTAAFRLKGSEQEYFASQDDTSAGLLRPFLQGAGLTAFGKPKTDSYLLFIPKGFTAKGMGIDKEKEPLPSEEEAWTWFSGNYPAAADHLLPFKEKAKKRTDKGDYWWELRACDYYGKFDKPKIFYQRFQVKPCFVYDDSSTFSNDSMFFLSVHDKALLSLLCSETGWWLIGEFCPRIQHGYMLTWDNFKQIPIPRELPTELNALAEDLMQAKADNDTETYKKNMEEVNRITAHMYSLGDCNHFSL